MSILPTIALQAWPVVVDDILPLRRVDLVQVDLRVPFLPFVFALGALAFLPAAVAAHLTVVVAGRRSIGQASAGVLPATRNSAGCCP